MKLFKTTGCVSCGNPHNWSTDKFTNEKDFNKKMEICMCRKDEMCNFVFENQKDILILLKERVEKDIKGEV
jgi:hypothetical protein